MISFPLLDYHVFNRVQILSLLVFEVDQVKDVVPEIVLHLDVVVETFVTVTETFNIVSRRTADEAVFTNSDILFLDFGLILSLLHIE